MNFLDLARSRYSCKNYRSDQIRQDQLQGILEAGRLAPTAKNLQEQRIYVVQSQAGLEKIDSLTPCRYGAPTVLVIAYDKTNTFTYPGQVMDSGVEDATIVATHMMLAAKSLGVDSCWINFFDPAKAKELLDLAENEEIVCFLDLGFADQDGGPKENHNKRKALEETVSYL
ncbi:MAG: nitroreductase family protein [Bacillota bacterium]|nr:nitroreductase family protein [Bacillota bacterium]